MSRKKFVSLLLLLAGLQTCLVLNAQPAGFPLKLSANRKYLTDVKNKPFLIKEISAWGLIQALSEKDAAAFIDSVKQKGFNTLLVSIISYDTRFAGNPPDWQGISPFKIKWDFTSYNIPYFEHADRFLQMAQVKGMLILLVPCYLGYKGDANQGWWDELLNPNNSVAKSRQYGEFLGQRYKDFANIIWVAGGDNRSDSVWHPHMDNIIQGIKQFDKAHLWTGHFGGWPSEDLPYAKYIDIDGLYDFVETDLGKTTTQYKTELEHYGKGRMIFQMDQSYEHDIPHVADNEDEQWIRRKNYDGLLSGCGGTSFCPGLKGNREYVLTNWQPLMNTEGMQEANYCFKLFGSRTWQLLMPDSTNKIITDGRGIYNTINYVCAAKATDNSTYIAYLATWSTLTINLTAIKVKKVKAWWFNPRDGKALLIGTFEANEIKKFSAPDNEDWVLVLDDAALGLGEPGK